MKKFVASVLFFFALVLAALGQNIQSLNLPTNTIGPLKPLRSLEDAFLTAELHKKINANQKWRTLVTQKKMAIGLVDLRNMQNIKYASVNGDEMMYAASLPKIAVLLAAMDAIEKGILIQTPEVTSDMSLMISKSDNQATTRMIDRLGFLQIETVLTDPRYELYDENYGGGLWVGKRYASQGARNPDPIKGLSHAATASQVCRFFYLMIHGQLVSQNRSEQMLKIMVDPKLHHKFVNTLDQIAPKAKVFRKSGSWSTYHSDCVLVWGPNRKYILVGLLDDPGGEQILRSLVTSIEDVLKIKR
jgi:beta-lactamase class A